MSKDATSPPRFTLPDILKGIAVIRMILVHLMQVFATQELYESFAGRLIVFLLGPPGAPLFLIIMGYFIAVSEKSFQTSLYRGVKLLVWAMLLNLGMNLHLLIRVINGTLEINPWPYIFGVDILFLAGFSMLILAVFKKYFQHSLKAWGLLALILLLAGQVIPHYTGSLQWPDYLQAFFTGHTHWAYFPIFPWAAYPVAGYLFYLLNERYRFSDFSRKGLVYLASALFVIVAVSFSWGFPVYYSFYAYHHHWLPFALWVLIVVACWIIIIRLLSMGREGSLISLYLRWAGRYITNFYVFQWLLIGNIGTAIYKTRGAEEIVLWFFIITALSSVLVYFWRKLKGRTNRTKQAKTLGS